MRRFATSLRLATALFARLTVLTFALGSIAAADLPTADSYRGIWYFNQRLTNEYQFKYSGGFATYPQQHVPIAIYSAKANKTFFVYGGTTARASGDRQELLHMVSYYDHASGTVPRPRILLNKQTDDAHDNPVLSLDDAGHLWVFSASHGTGRPSYIHRSDKPLSIDSFTRVATTNFSYPQPWHVPGEGFLFLHTRYGANKLMGVAGQRNLFSLTSPDGNQWTSLQALAGIERGDYQVSWLHGSKVGTALDFHPPPLGLNARANIYYLETKDFGGTWSNVRGEALTLPLITEQNAALAYDSRKSDELVYLKDLNFDSAGRPVILFLTSKGFESGPHHGPRTWKTIHWNGTTWKDSTITTSGNNYDHGSIYVEENAWRVIAPTASGPQAFNPGGEMEMWISRDAGRNWKLHRQLTRNSPLNHTYARRPLHAHPGFYALWADGHGRQPSTSSLYFTDREGTGVWRLPTVMAEAAAKPEKVF